jgi:hypothetical protein
MRDNHANDLLASPLGGKGAYGGAVVRGRESRSGRLKPLGRVLGTIPAGSERTSHPTCVAKMSPGIAVACLTPLGAS